MHQKFEKNSSEFRMFGDFWKLCQSVWNVEDDDDYWEKVVRWTGVFSKRYESIGLAEKLAAALLSDLEEKYRREYKK